MKKVKVRSWGDQETFSEKNGGGQKNAKCPTLQGVTNTTLTLKILFTPRKYFKYCFTAL